MQQDSKCTEIVIRCSDGVRLTAKYYNPPPSPTSTPPPQTIVCLHGWLDNAASFHLLAPSLLSRLSSNKSSSSEQLRILALDLPGHGHSSHKSPDGPTWTLSEYAYYLSEAMAQLHLIPHGDDGGGGGDDVGREEGGGVILIGHSMGASVALLYASAFPEHVRKLILLDGALLARKAVDTPHHLKQAIVRRREASKVLYGGGGGGGGRERTTTVERAVALRRLSAEMLPGDQSLSREAALAIVCRSVVPVLDGEEGEGGGDDDAMVRAGFDRVERTTVSTDNTTTTTTTTTNDYDGNVDDEVGYQRRKPNPEHLMSQYTGPIRFRHDKRLHWPSIHYLTPAQVEAIYRAVTCPVCFLRARNGYPIPSDDGEGGGGGGGGDLVTELLKPTVMKVLDGSHHFHADPETVGGVVEEVVRFLE